MGFCRPFSPTHANLTMQWSLCPLNIPTGTSSTSHIHSISSSSSLRNSKFGSCNTARVESLRLAISTGGRYSTTILVISADNAVNGSALKFSKLLLLLVFLASRSNTSFGAKPFTSNLLSKARRPGMSTGLATRYSQPGSCRHHCSLATLTAKSRELSETNASNEQSR